MAKKKGTSVIVSKLPDCDFCIGHEPAKYDGKTIHGPWANMCERHFKKYGIGLGTGLGQELKLKEVSSNEEVPKL
jgi:hypothetical protein